MKLPQKHGNAPQAEVNPALADLAQLDEATVALLGRAKGASWYEDVGNEVDIAVAALCRLRRAGAGARGGSDGGDEAVREAFARTDSETVIWIASRTISYLDEHGFPEGLGPPPSTGDAPVGER